MDNQAWKARWKAEEAVAHIHGWDFSHIEGRYDEERDLPWTMTPLYAAMYSRRRS